MFKPRADTKTRVEVSRELANALSLESTDLQSS